jgi:hypothetical protein
VIDCCLYENGNDQSITFLKKKKLHLKIKEHDIKLI